MSNCVGFDPRGVLAMFALRGCACHVFGSEISLESHFLGSKICNMNFPVLGGKKFQQLSFLLDSVLQCLKNSLLPSNL